MKGSKVVVLGGAPHNGAAQVADEALLDALLLSLLQFLLHLVNVLWPVRSLVGVTQAKGQYKSARAGLAHIGNMAGL